MAYRRNIEVSLNEELEMQDLRSGYLDKDYSVHMVIQIPGNDRTTYV